MAAFSISIKAARSWVFLKMPCSPRSRSPFCRVLVLVAFSDGVTESVNAYGEEFGMRRLEEEVLLHRDLGADRLLQSLLAAVEKWSGASEQSDDVTIVVAHME